MTEMKLYHGASKKRIRARNVYRRLTFSDLKLLSLNIKIQVYKTYIELVYTGVNFRVFGPMTHLLREGYFIFLQTFEI